MLSYGTFSVLFELKGHGDRFTDEIAMIRNRGPLRGVTLLPSNNHAPRGSVSTRASKYSLCSRTGGNVPSRGFQDGQHGHGAAEELESAAIGGNMLVVAGARTEKVAQFIVSPAEPGG